MTDKIRIEQYTLIDFTRAIVEKAKEGYELSLTNEGAPQSLGFGYYFCDMVKVEKPINKAEPVVQDEAKPAKRTTKSRSKAN